MCADSQLSPRYTGKYISKSQIVGVMIPLIWEQIWGDAIELGLLSLWEVKVHHSRAGSNKCKKKIKPCCVYTLRRDS